MEPNWPIVAQVSAPLIALFVGAALNRILERRTRLIYFLGHASSHTIKPAPGSKDSMMVIHTHSLVLRNNGGVAAHNVRVGHVLFPDSIDVFPPSPFTIEKLENGMVDLVFPTIVPGEHINISYLYGPAMTADRINAYVKSDEGVVNRMDVMPTRIYPKWFNLLGLSLLLIGIGTIIYFILLVIIMMATAPPPKEKARPATALSQRGIDSGRELEPHWHPAPLPPS